MPCTCEPNSRSGTSATTRATVRLLRAQATEVFAHRLRAAPPLRDLGPSLAQLAQDQLALDPGVVEQAERSVDGRRRGGVAEAVRDEQPPVPVVVRVGLRVAGRQVDGGVD